MLSTHELFDIASRTVLICSIAHSFLPPWDFLNDFPRAQKYYKAGIYLIGYIAINGRSTVYRSISAQQPAALPPPPKDEATKP